MINQIRDWIFITKESERVASTVIDEALKHYCHLCKRGFKTISAAAAHKSIKHK